MSVPDFDRPPVDSESDAMFVPLLRLVMDATGAARGTLSIARAGTTIVKARTGFDGPPSTAPFPSGAPCDLVRVALGGAAAGTALFALERDSAAGAPAQLPAAVEQLLRDHLPQLLECETLMRDVGERRRTSGSIIDEALEPFISMDRHGFIAEWNRAAATTFGWSREEALGRVAADLIVPPELREAHRRGFASFGRTGQSNVVGHRITLPALRRDGSRLLVEMRVSVAYSSEGHATFHAFLHDVTELEQTRERLSRSENLLREAQQIVSLGSFEHDLATDEVFCSDELFRIVGLERDEFDGRASTLRSLVHPDDIEAVSVAYLAARRARRVHDFEFRLCRPSGDIVSLRHRGHWVYDEAGRAARFIGTVQDVTEARRLEAARLELEIQIAEAFDRAPFGMSMTSARPGDLGTFIRVNSAYCALLGYPADEVVGFPCSAFVDPQDAGLNLDATAALLTGAADAVHREFRMLRRDGRTIWVRETRSLMRDARGQARYFFAHVEDVTQRRIDQIALAESNARLRRSLDTAPLGMALTSIGTDAPGRFIEVNPALCRLTGFSRAELLELTFEELIHPDGRQHAAAAMHELVSGVEAFCTFEERYRRADGSNGWMLVHGSAGYDSAGRAMYCVTQMLDITKRKAAESKLAHLAYHDALTGVLNRRGLTLEIKQRFPAGAGETPAALLLIDLDHFKYVNDTMGHAAGDRILRKVAKILRETCQGDEIVARLGGDEFIVVAAGRTEAAASALADALRYAIGSQLHLGNDSALRATASIGIVIVEHLSHPSIGAAVAAADSALAAAKAQGRDRSSVARSLVSHNEMKAELTWSQRIRRALERDEFALHAQPILNLRTGIVDRYELLLRMIDADGSLIMPGAFLPVAERVGLMAEIDSWVVKAAIARAAEVQRTGRRVVFEVNLSGASLTNENVTTRIEHELRSSELDPGALVFEITETAAIDKMDQACSFAERITALGCAFALDDFGAGFSSFYYLKYLPFNYLKIDGEFIRNLTTDNADQHIVQAIVALARGMGKQTIAEFVGDEETAILLQTYGVDYAQGYYIGKPAPWGNAERAVAAGETTRLAV